MRSPIGLALGVVLAFTAPSVGADISADLKPSFARMSGTDTVRIEYASIGPAGPVEHALEASLSMGQLSVADADSDGGGSVMIAKSHVEGLDRLLAHYRSGPPARCDRTDDVTFTWKRGGTPLTEETFRDRSCAAETTCGVLPISYLGALLEGRTPPETKIGVPCDLKDSLQATTGLVRETIEYSHSGDGLARLFGLALMMAFGIGLAAAALPLILGIGSGHWLLGLVGCLATVVTMAVLVPFLGVPAPFLVALAFSVAIMIVPGRRPRRQR